MNAGTNATAQSDLGAKIVIVERDRAEWFGSRAQIEAEGLVPGGTAWPASIYPVEWKAGHFQYALRRARMPGCKGRVNTWAQRDYFSLHRRLASQGLDGFLTAREFELRKELAEMLYWRTPAYLALCERWAEARKDQSFQRFKAVVGC